MNMQNAVYIWDKIVYLNIGSILMNKKSSLNYKVKEKTHTQTKTFYCENNNTKNIELEINGEITQKVNIKDKVINANEELFKWVNFIITPSKSYNVKSKDIFNKTLSKQALFEYLFDGVSGPAIEKNLTMAFHEMVE